MDRVECVVVGAGVVGLAIARSLAECGREVVVLEAADAIGTATSSRNSEVIHAGLYYPTGSAKARLCVEGREDLYAYCAERAIGHRRCGKLVVAADETDLDYLTGLRQRAMANGVTDVRLIDGDEMRAMEPSLAGVGALLSPSTGIIDSHGLMLAYQGDAEAAGAMIAFNTPVIRGEAGDAGIVLETGGESPMQIVADTVINAAGLGAWSVSGRIAGVPGRTIPKRHLAKGNYFSLAGRSPFSRLIYPVPEPGGLGVHLTLDLGGQARFGPDVEWLDADHSNADGLSIDYDVDPARSERFHAAIRRYWPDLPQSALEPAYSGVRPKIAGRGEGPGDFVIQGPDETGVPGYVALYGIESPGLTASLAIARHVAAFAGKAGD
ncbi:NAD(P)/FAD-dependent oxidoreductase [Fodinicurvata sp. EGI_FJ10296]|uniref:NAD(P)/FAD-dependent oxidoreductase n=1 Tax=Fodinicurvata sp. EGI_FJ10296 TaxID=3231908 RepID=UPI003454E5F3